MRQPIGLAAALCMFLVSACLARQPGQPQPPPQAAQAPLETRDGVASLPHVEIDLNQRQVRVECETLHVEMLLEFFCVVAGGPEHETVLRTRAKPSHIHLGLLMLGLKPGEPLRYSPAADRWLPPSGPPLRISMEYERDGQTVRHPASRWMRNAETKQEMPETTWIFAGSRIMEDGNYAADITGYVVSIVNFDLTVIDVPELVSSSNELLEWEAYLDRIPEPGTKVWMIIEPVGERDVEAPAAREGETVVRLAQDGTIEVDAVPVELEHLTERLQQMHAQRPIRVRLFVERGVPQERSQQANDAITAAGVPMGFARPTDEDHAEPGARLDEQRMQQLRQRWEQAVAPHRPALREAAQTHYEVINTLRQEQQRLISEADRIQRVIEELERSYQDMTTPRAG
jgi:hypothetical protein